MKFELKNEDCLKGLLQLEDKSLDLVVSTPDRSLIIEASKILFSKIKDDGFYCLDLTCNSRDRGLLFPFSIAVKLQVQGWILNDIVIMERKEVLIKESRLMPSFHYHLVLGKKMHNKYPNADGKKDIYKADFKENEAYTENNPRFFVETFSKEGDLVCDPFAGTNSTGKVCKELNRNYVGFEKNENLAKKYGDIN